MGICKNLNVFEKNKNIKCKRFFCAVLDLFFTAVSCIQYWAGSLTVG